MPILPIVGRRSRKIRVVICGIYLLLSIGGIAMVYPFLITLTQSVSNAYDCERYDAFPRYLFNAKERYLKYLADRYHNFQYFRAAYNAPFYWGAFRDIAYDPRAVDKHFPVFGSEVSRKKQLKVIYDDYCEFLELYSLENSMLLFQRTNRKHYQDFLLERYGRIFLEKTGKRRKEISRKEYEKGALQTMAELCGTSYTNFTAITGGREGSPPFDLQIWFPPADQMHTDYLDFMRSRPVSERMPVTRHFLWSKYLLSKIPEFNKLWPEGACPYKTIYDIPFELPQDTPQALKDLKTQFIKDFWPLRLVRINSDEEPGFRTFIKGRYPSLTAFNQLAKTSYTSWDDIPFSQTAPSSKNLVEQAQWRDFVLSLPRQHWEILCPETGYRKFLINRYKTLQQINTDYGWSANSINNIKLPIPETDYYHYITRKTNFFVSFLTQNYKTVLEFLIFKGRAFRNTVVLVFFSVLAALTVNPLAAYALSRFRPRQTYQILIFLLATMAFPPMVAAIPGFLLLRDLHLLNTYYALILPGVANGFSIFLLKGFFDSLPNELYEAASIDGAREYQMFLRIAVPLCKPILAVIALNTFIASYGGFMWALIVCQKEEMWTIMVWMLQFRGMFEPFVVTAGFVVVSIPTFMVFMFCQKIILRGIIIPQMK